ncbi:MAG: hypothetical protein AAF513_15680 [Pseudomonadota bacterium]
MNLKQLQALTGLFFAVFLGVHLINLWLAPLGAAAYDGFQAVAQRAYQWLPLETLLLACLLVHAAIGLWRMRERRPPSTPQARWHRRAGVFLLIFIAGHIMAVRGPSWFADIYPGFSGLAFSIDFAPLYFYPYYFLLALAGFYHGLYGATRALARFGLRFDVRLGLWTTAAGLCTVAALMGFGGVFGLADDPYESEFARLVLRWIG